VIAPREVRPGETVTVILGVTPALVCTGGVNVPSTGSFFRFVPIEVTASTTGRILIQFETFQSDSRGWAYLAVRCADGRIIQIEIRLV
jgi:hypothetical protein